MPIVSSSNTVGHAQVDGRRYVTDGIVSRTNRGLADRTRQRLYTTVYELAGPEAVETAEFTAMRGWAQFAPHVRSETRVILAR